MSYEKVTSLINNSNKIIILTGAGISVNAGIPDFRSSGGIFQKIKKEFGLSTPEELFDITSFKKDPSRFYIMFTNLWLNIKDALPTKTHKFIKSLEDKNKLLANYTQNIDDLERKSGVNKVLQCHGSIDNGICLRCNANYKLDTLYNNQNNKFNFVCTINKLGKICGGIIKPNIEGV